jgi:hypothetical protein
MSAWPALMNSENTPLYVGRNVIAGSANALQPGTETAEGDAARAPAMEPSPGKAPAVKASGRAAPRKSKEAKGAPAESEEEPVAPPECEIFSAIDLMVKHLTRVVDGAPPFAGEWKDVFVQALARAPIVTVAARIAGVSRTRALEARLADVEFARRWDEAMEEGTDEIEAAAFRSAVYGEEKPIYHQGQIKGWTVEYSHAMRTMLLKSKRPELFADKEEPKAPAMKHMTLDEFEKRVEEAMRS